MKTTDTPNILTQTSITEIASFTRRSGLSLWHSTHRCHPEYQQAMVDSQRLTLGGLRHG